MLKAGLVSNFLHKYQFTGNVLLFFKGFDHSFYDDLVLVPGIDHFVDQSIDAVFDNKSQNKSRKMIQALLQAKGVQWGTYEELITLANDIINLGSVYQGKIVVVNNNLFRSFYPSYDLNLKSLEKSEDRINISKTTPLYAEFSQSKESSLVQYVLKHEKEELGVPVADTDFYSLPSSTDSVSDKLPDNAKAISSYALNDIVASCYKGQIRSESFVISDSKLKYINRDYISILNMVFKDQKVHFVIGSQDSKALTSISQSFKHLQYLKEYWGKNAEYRDGEFYSDPDISMDIRHISQSKIIDDVLTQVSLARNKGKAYYDLVVTAPTGSGKSLFFQIPGIVLHKEYREITIVITPLQALMKDQADGLSSRGIDFATYINSQISLEERNRRLRKIKNGKYSILYVSPELLLDSKIDKLIGNRRIGLFVVDEAHLVTSWGRDFRVDYWFLGDYLNKLRNGSYYSKTVKRDFPILILTATAVLGGKNDQIGTLIEDLNLRVDENKHMYIGKVRRDQIEFQIHQVEKSEGNTKEDKIEKVVDRIKEFVYKDIKTIIYCPYSSQCATLMLNLRATDEKVRNKIAYYYGSMSSDQKVQNYTSFKNGESTIMIATTAFGMGIDIDDIQAVYHLAPTGGLSEYVQEIGRAARKLDRGYAITDFFKNDLHYARTLWGLGGIRQYQLREIAMQLSNLSQNNKTRNLLVSPESFGHLFDTGDVDQKVKSGLMLLTTDLEERYHFKVITIRPKPMYTRQFIQASGGTLEQIKKDLKGFVKPILKPAPQRDPGNFHNGDIITTQIGEFLEIDLGKLWEERYNSLSFPDFKRQFFNNSLFDYDDKVTPKMQLKINYGEPGFDIVKNSFNEHLGRLSDLFLQIQRENGSHYFSLNYFKKMYNDFFGSDDNTQDNAAQLVLELFVPEEVSNDNHPFISWKFMTVRRKQSTQESEYGFRKSGLSKAVSEMKRSLQLMTPNKDGIYNRFLVIPKFGEQQKDIHMLMASLLQIWGLATYEIIGGYNSQIFVRINDPQKLRKIAVNKRYKNNVLTDIDKRHADAGTFMSLFLGRPRDSKKDWDIIEKYFLGRDEEVERLL